MKNIFYMLLPLVFSVSSFAADIPNNVVCKLLVEVGGGDDWQPLRTIHTETMTMEGRTLNKWQMYAEYGAAHVISTDNGLLQMHLGGATSLSSSYVEISSLPTIENEIPPSQETFAGIKRPGVLFKTLDKRTFTFVCGTSAD